jgi:hypothetical protein
MIEVESDQLKQAVEGMHNCKARLVQSVPLRERFERKTVWEGVVHVFALDGPQRRLELMPGHPR